MSDRRDDDTAGGGALSPEDWVRLQFEALQEDVADEQRARGRRAAPVEPDAQPAASEPAEQTAEQPAASEPAAQPSAPEPAEQTSASEPAASSESAEQTSADPAPATPTDATPVEAQPAEPAAPATPTWSAPSAPAEPPAPSLPVSPPPARRRAESAPVEPASSEPAVDFGLPPTSLPPQAFGAPSPSTPDSVAEPASEPAEPRQEPIESTTAATDPAAPAPAATDPATASATASARPTIDESWGEPTQAMSAVPPAELDDEWGEPTQAMSLPKPGADDAWGEPTQAMPVPPTAVGPSTEETGLDDLFGDNRFREVDDSVAGEAPQRDVERSRERQPREPMPRNVRILAWVAGGLIAVLALLGLFWLGVQSPWSSAAPAPSPTATSETPTPTPEPTAEQPVEGPVAPGTYAWDELGGGECLEAFPNAWAEEYTVVDCAQPHAAQLVSLTELGQSTDAWPGLESLAGEANVRCAEAISLDAAGQYDDIVLEASYAATEEAWQDGDNAYACFARRSGAEAIEGSLQA